MRTDDGIRVLVADAHPIFRIGIRALIGAEPGIEMIGEADDGDGAVVQVQELRPDVLLLDLHLPRASGLEVLKRLAALRLDTRTVLLAGSIDRVQMRAALVRGARGVLLKHTATDLLAKCIRRVHDGEYWVERDAVGDLVDALRHPARPGESAGVLTVREREIVALVMTGASNKDIAWQLGVNEQTVKNHLRKVFDKLEVTNRVELALVAVERRLVTPTDGTVSPGSAGTRRRP